MAFEIRRKDLLGRIGLLRTKNGAIETPLLLPVVNPNSQLIPAPELRSSFGFDAVITNAYLVWRQLRGEGKAPNIHDLLKFDGIIVTDSGAYQILRYGDVEVQANDIVRFQEQLESDIAVILDIPTDQAASKARAKWTATETLRRADEALQIINRKDILWVGPVQGGVYSDLVAESAIEMGKRQFAIHALGSPTTVMQQYQYEVLVDMVMAAKLNLPADRPLHLFGAGHPMMFALAIALGCDIFDSASYAIFARNGRYLTVQGTSKVDDLEYFPCNCLTCHHRNPAEVRKMLLPERERFLASHNLHICFSEVQTVKQAIAEGRLWELVESRSQNHPSLQRAFQRMRKYAGALERETPVRKLKGPFAISRDSLSRPEILRHQKRLIGHYTLPVKVKIALLIPQKYLAPFGDNPEQAAALEKMGKGATLHVCAYDVTYGVIPEELLDVYPLAQTESSLAPGESVTRNAADRIIKYLLNAGYSYCMIVSMERWQKRLAKSIQLRLIRKMKVKLIETNSLDEATILRILNLIKLKKR